MPQDQTTRSRLRQFITWSNLVWLLIIAVIVLTIVVTVWASKQPNLSFDSGPPLS